jgi:hypothetical protein
MLIPESPYQAWYGEAPDQPWRLARECDIKGRFCVLGQSAAEPGPRRRQHPALLIGPDFRAICARPSFADATRWAAARRLSNPAYYKIRQPRQPCSALKEDPEPRPTNIGPFQLFPLS